MASGKAILSSLLIMFGGYGVLNEVLDKA